MDITNRGILSDVNPTIVSCIECCWEGVMSNFGKDCKVLLLKCALNTMVKLMLIGGM